MSKATEIIQKIDELEDELYKNYEHFMKKDEIIEGLKDKYTDFIEHNYFELKRDDLKKIAISAMLQLNGSQLMKMFEDLEERLIDYDEVMKNKQELEEKIEKSMEKFKK